jgi:hypothetical protein
MANREGVAMDTATQEPLSGIGLKKRIQRKAIKPKAGSLSATAGFVFCEKGY